MAEAKVTINDSVISVALWGDFSMRCPNGDDLRPQSLKARFVIACLILAPEQRKSRRALAQLIWHGREPAQALGSLRQALNDIRGSLGPHVGAVQSDRHEIWIVPERFCSDLESPNPKGDLLEDFLTQDKTLLSWLQATRAAHRKELASGLPKPMVAIETRGEGIHAEVFSNGVSTSLADWCAARVAMGSESFASEDAAKYLLASTTEGSGPNVLSSVSLKNRASDHLVWSTNSALSANPVSLLHDHGVHKLINRTVDRTIFEIQSPFRDSEEGAFLQQSALGAVQLIFRNGSGDLEAARRQLDANFDLCNRGIYLAWAAYTLTFLKAERNHADLDALRDEARELVARAIELEPHSAMVLALCSYVTSYLIGDRASGFYLGSQAIELNRSNPLAWIFRGAANFYGGDVETAYRDVAFARAIAGEGPYRYVVEFYGCIVSTLTNRLEEAQALGQISSTLSPNFKAPLRYLAMIHAANGHDAALADVLDQIRAVEPGFELEMLAEASYPVQALRRSSKFLSAIASR